EGVRFKDWFLITSLGDQRIILGMPWLKEHDPIITWSDMTMSLDQTKIKRNQRVLDKLREEFQTMEIDEDQELLIRYLQATEEDDLWIRAKTSVSQELEHKHRQEEKKAELPKEYEEWKDIFDKKAAERFPQPRPWDHEIKLKDGFVPKVEKIYPLNPKQQPVFDEWLKEQLDKGYITPSKSPQAAGFFFVSKKDSKALRPCQDYRYLNDWTVKNAYPLPLVSDLLNKIKGAKYFTKLDLRQGYNNVRIKKGDEWKAAFITPRGLFEPKVMYFGLCNSPATFQTMMDSYFQDLINEGWIVIYMDDILLYANTREELREMTKRVLQRLKERDLFLKLEKCKFEQEEIDFLGMVISHNNVKMDPIKLAGIKDWPAPKVVKQVRSFLGFCNFYRRFISHYSEKALPLTNLTKKSVPFAWTPECQQAFDTLKRAFEQGPILLLPDPAKQYHLETDASKRALGAVLRQHGPDGQLHPVAYLSHTLSPTEQNYQVYDRELLAIVTALKTWKYLLCGTTQPVMIRTDHKNLTYYRSTNRLNGRQARWQLLLSEFNIKMEYQPGKELIQADALSRRHDHVDDTGKENVLTMLPESMWVRYIAPDLRDEIKKATEEDSLGQKIIEALKEKTPLPIRGENKDWFYTDGILRRKGTCYVPDNSDLRKRLIKTYHEAPTSGHPGRFKTTMLLIKDYYWPGMGVMVQKFIEGCATCQRLKPDTHPTVPGLTPIGSNATRPFEQISMDFITDLPESEGYDSILVVVDQGLTKGVIFIPCHKTIDAMGTVDLYLKHVYTRFGLPSVMISDRGPQFSSKAFQELRKALGIDHRMSTAYHPQTDGQTERVNQELENHLRILCKNDTSSWVKALPIAELAHNQRTHEARHMSPFKLMYGTDPVAIPTAIPRTSAPAVEERLKELKGFREEALAAHELNKQ
ncbi:MAG TPA: RNase H-like domain-containing protein, partial [Stellaceae bacterium]|nr:RNase H-like domain-containing protein [Stellaceae bacterium]